MSPFNFLGYPNLLGVYILGEQFRGQFFKSIIFNKSPYLHMKGKNYNYLLVI